MSIVKKIKKALTRKKPTLAQLQDQLENANNAYLDADAGSKAEKKAEALVDKLDAAIKAHKDYVRPSERNYC